jgi:hypothetical protein
MSYVEMLELFATGNTRMGVNRDGAIRNIRALFLLQNPNPNDFKSWFASDWNRFYRSRMSDRDVEELLENMGRGIAVEYQKLFGEVDQPLMQPDSDFTPLYETGELADKTAFRTSISKIVEEI